MLKPLFRALKRKFTLNDTFVFIYFLNKEYHNIIIMKLLVYFFTVSIFTNGIAKELVDPKATPLESFLVKNLTFIIKPFSRNDYHFKFKLVLSG